MQVPKIGRNQMEPYFTIEFLNVVHLLSVLPTFHNVTFIEHQFSNIERTRICSSTGHRTRTPYFWLWTIEHPTSNLMGPSLDLLNCNEHTRTSVFRTSNELERVHLLVIELEHPIFGFERKNLEPNRALLDLLSKLLFEHHFFEHWKNSNVFFYW